MLIIMLMIWSTLAHALISSRANEARETIQKEIKMHLIKYSLSVPFDRSY